MKKKTAVSTAEFQSVKTSRNLHLRSYNVVCSSTVLVGREGGILFAHGFLGQIQFKQAKQKGQETYSSFSTAQRHTLPTHYLKSNLKSNVPEDILY